MKSLIKDSSRHHKASAILREEFIPPGSVVHSFAFYGGEIEFTLAEHNRFVCAHSNRQMVYEFWKCAMQEPHRLYNIILADIFKFEGKDMFNILQENWFKYRDPYMRSAFFYLLNRCSTTGLASSGELDLKDFNAPSLMHLLSFTPPPNFHLKLDEGGPDILDNLSDDLGADYLLIAAGNYKRNLLTSGKALGCEETSIHHRNLKKKLSELESKWIVIYNYHPRLEKLYERHRRLMINRYGRPTESAAACEEIIIANF